MTVTSRSWSFLLHPHWLVWIIEHNSTDRLIQQFSRQMVHHNFFYITRNEWLVSFCSLTMFLHYERITMNNNLFHASMIKVKGTINNSLQDLSTSSFVCRENFLANISDVSWIWFNFENCLPENNLDLITISFIPWIWTDSGRLSAFRFSYASFEHRQILCLINDNCINSACPKGNSGFMIDTTSIFLENTSTQRKENHRF